MKIPNMKTEGPQALSKLWSEVPVVGIWPWQADGKATGVTRVTGSSDPPAEHEVGKVATMPLLCGLHHQIGRWGQVNGDKR